LIENGVNMLFVIGGDGTMKGACKIDAEMSRRGKKCVVCCVPKTIDNDVRDAASVLQVASTRPSERPHRSL